MFPGNIKYAIDGLACGRNQLGPAYHLPRLLFQPIIVWWTLLAGELISWPFDASVAKSRSPVDWRKVNELARDLETQREATAAHVAATNPAEAFDLRWRMLEFAPSIHERRITIDSGHDA